MKVQIMEAEGSSIPGYPLSGNLQTNVCILERGIFEAPVSNGRIHRGDSGIKKISDGFNSILHL
ncbi:hypothetical protein JCM16138_09690 [Thermococcus atlanticus]